MLDITRNSTVNVEAAAPPPRVVDTHGLLLLQASKAAKACDAADAVDGLAVLRPTLRVAATAFGVSAGSIARARRLTPEQREAVRRGRRPLVLPRPTPSASSSLPVIVMSPQQRLIEIVDEIGLDRTLNLLNCIECVPGRAA